MDGNAMEGGEEGFEALPEPAGDDFAGGVFEAGDVVEVVVVELVYEGLEGFLDIAEVHKPAGLRIDGATEGEVDLVGVAVQASALVAGGDFGEAIGGFEGKRLGKFDEKWLVFWYL